MVNTSLFTALSGLRSHQSHIDIIGANLANVSTPGYRGARATFSDILSFTIRPGAGPNGDFGGQNPMQVGLGASIASIDVNTNQGTFQDTGRPLDVALQGRGFFALTNGQQSFYTRVGAFGVDANRQLVDVRTGFRVLGSNGADIQIPDSDTLPAQATSSVNFGGSLPATVGGPLAEIVESSSALLAGTAAVKTGTPAAGTTYNMSAFLGGSLLVSLNGQAQQRVTFAASDFANPAAATAAEIATVVDAATTGLEVSANGVTGQLTYASVALGEDATLKFDDATGSTGLLANLGLTSTLVAGSQSAALATTDLTDMTTRVARYAIGDQIRVEGTNPDGTPFSSTFVYGAANDGTTVGDMLTFVNGLLAPGAATATLDANGKIVLTATDKGPADMSLHIGDLTTSTKNAWTTFAVTQDGAGPDEAVASIDVIDSLGRSHAVTFTFTRSSNDTNVWDMKASIDASQGTITADSISAIRFNDDGSFNVIGGGSNTLTFAWNGITTAQSVAIDLGTSGQFDGVTMLGGAATVAAVDQDGFGPGALLNVAIDQQGNLAGYYTNGQSRTLATLRIALFANEAGLLRAGDTMFVEAPNSDSAITTVAGSAGAGSIRAGSLENSNVDIAEEFVKLIEAQRGFQANSRVITTTDEILAELVNIVR
jgi:flagellar hook protein FlgE